MITLIIARHGNTFESGETPRRAGARTDIPLVEKGRQQAAALGRYLKGNNLLPDEIYASALQRTKETAKIAVQAAGLSGTTVTPLDIFNEIDYGPDENKTEEDVISRIGMQAIKDWDEKALVPDGWDADPEQIIADWQNFAAQAEKAAGQEGGARRTILVVTSNGTARFAPYIAGNYDDFCAEHKIKLATGALGILHYDGGKWQIKAWNIRP